VNLRQYLLIFRARYRLALGAALVVLALGLPTVQLLPKQYTASTSMVLDIRSADPLTALLMPNNMATQEDIIRSDRVALKVISALKLDQDPQLRAQWADAGAKGSFVTWLAERLQKSLVINPVRREGNTITIQFKAGDPRFAAAAANAFAQAYVDAAVELRVEPAKEYARWFGEQGKALREELEATQARLAAFQQTKGILTRDETLDAETTRLNELTSQLTAAQADVVAARSKQRSAGGTQPLADVLDNTVIANLRADIARQEAKLQDANRNLGRNHPQFRGMEAELAELKARLAGEMRQVAGSFSTTRAVSTDRAVELRAAVEAQRKKLLGLRAERDQLAVLQRDAEAAKNAYEAVERRYNQTHLETQATQTSVFLLHPAVEPVTPSSPKPLRDSAAVLVIGLVLGMAAALLREMLDRRVRCVDDVSGLLEIPVLVVLGNEAKRRSIAVERPPARVPLLR
jgi:succinoglycan biosynthesis transport protein ExoP